MERSSNFKVLFYTQRKKVRISPEISSITNQMVAVLMGMISSQGTPFDTYFIHTDCMVSKIGNNEQFIYSKIKCQPGILVTFFFKFSCIQTIGTLTKKAFNFLKQTEVINIMQKSINFNEVIQRQI